MAETRGRHLAAPAGRDAGSVYTPPLEILSASSWAAASRVLSSLVPAAGPAREDALVEFMQRLVPRYAGPLLIFDLVRVEQVLLTLAAIQALHRCRFLAPVKSFPNPVFLALAGRYLAGFDVSNLEEYHALPGDLSGKMVAVAGPVFRTEQLPRFLDRGNDLVVYADSPHQLAQIETLQLPIEYGIRLDSAHLLQRRANEPRSESGHSRFGFSAEELLRLRPILERSRHRFAGVLVHHGSEQNSAECYLALVEEILPLLAKLGIGGHSINLGGGEHRLALNSLAGLVGRIRERLGEDTGLSFEPGRLLTQAAGYAVGRIENWRRRDGAVEYVLDLSMDCHLRWSKPTLIVPRPPEPGRLMRARFYGPTCHEEDCLGDHLMWSTAPGEPPFRPGELVLFGNVSGYSASIRTTFNGVAPLPVRFLHDRIGE